MSLSKLQTSYYAEAGDEMVTSHLIIDFTRWQVGYLLLTKLIAQANPKVLRAACIVAPT